MDEQWRKKMNTLHRETPGTAHAQLNAHLHQSSPPRRRLHPQSDCNTQQRDDCSTGISSTTRSSLSTLTMTLEKEKELSSSSSHTVEETSTRVCIKNVPLTFSEAKLAQHLTTNSKLPLTVTDCKILKTKNGKQQQHSRKLAFVGFKTVEMARHVVSRFHKTFASTSKLIVEPALTKKNASLTHRPWSKHSVGSSRYEKAHPKLREEEREEAHKKTDNTNVVDKRKEEYLAAMMGNSRGDALSKQKFWANDDAVAEVVQQEEIEDSPDDAAEEAEDDSDKDSDSDDDNDSSDSGNDSDDSGGEGANVMGSFSRKSAAQGTVVVGVSDLGDFMKSKVTDATNLDSDDDDNSSSSSAGSDVEKNETNAIVDNDDDGSTSSSSAVSTSSSSSSSEEEDDSDNEQQQEKTERISTAQDDDKNETERDKETVPSNRLFCRNLPFTTTEEELKEVFETFGTVVECHIPMDDLKRSKGYAFVLLEHASEAQKAMAQLDGTDFQGRLLHVLPAKQRPGSSNAANHTSNDGGGGTLTYKQQQLQARQEGASKHNMLGANASFVRGDAVVDNLSQRLGLQKGDIFNVKDGLGSGDAAVRLALGETHVISENRDYFAEHGIDMDALVGASHGGSSDTATQQKRRSTTSILVKNLPFDDTTMEDLTKTFHNVGGGDVPTRILLPPSRTIALVEYAHAVDARRAFKKLAYRRFKHVPLYLEWAPLSSINKNESSTSNQAKEHVTNQNVSQQQQQQEEEEDEDAAAEASGAEPGVSHTIYVKNLNFSTTEEQLHKVFSKHVKSIRAVKIPTKAAPVRRVGSTTVSSESASVLSMGYGFVECDSNESVRKAIKALQGTLVDGHALELKRSTKQVASTNINKQTKGKSKNPTKLMVHNVPFQATRKELLQLFGSFGQLKKVRLPKKFDGGHRGFAFVEFLTSQEAQTAMNSLSRTHLYGRHLVLEWASDKEDISDLRNKAKRDAFAASQTATQRQNKKIRFE